MARIVHLSDLHFGAHDENLVEAVEQSIDALEPHLVVISGDFTQRARTEQFKEACRFLERLRDKGHEVLAVPGNHDVPLYDVLRRFLSPLTRYRRFIDETLCPFIELPGIAVLGINTARSLTFKDGRINAEQIAFIRETFARTASNAVRILVTHHPLFAISVGETVERAIGGQELALDAIEEAGVDLLLAGHAHHAATHRASDLVTRAGGARHPSWNGDVDTPASAGAELQHNRYRRAARDGDCQRLEGRSIPAGRHAALRMAEWPLAHSEDRRAGALSLWAAKPFA